MPDENGKEVALKDLKGKTVILFFYPRANTPGCTIEARGFRDTYKQIQKTGAVLLGISPDTPKAQKNFQDKFDLPFTLLADAEKKVAIAFGVLREKNMYGKKVMGVARTTFISTMKTAKSAAPYPFPLNPNQQRAPHLCPC